MCGICKSGWVAYSYESADSTARALKLGRVHLGFTQAELAEKLGITEASVGRHERGENLGEHPWAWAYLLEQLADLGCDRRVLGLPSASSLRQEPEADPDSVATYENDLADALRQLERAVAAQSQEPAPRSRQSE